MNQSDAGAADSYRCSAVCVSQSTRVAELPPEVSTDWRLWKATCNRLAYSPNKKSKVKTQELTQSEVRTSTTQAAPKDM